MAVAKDTVVRDNGDGTKTITTHGRVLVTAPSAMADRVEEYLRSVWGEDEGDA